MPLDQEELAAQLAAAAARAPVYPEGRFAGRGIVICAGGARMFTCAWVCIGMLRRHLGCTLPIEVWHIGPEEMGPPMRGLLEALGAQAVDAIEVAKRHGLERLGGWELKSYALMYSRFREVLLLDADNVPIRDPSFLFERPEFQATGALFWPDSMRLSRSNAVWAIANLPPVESVSFESGQIVLDKARCWRALSLAFWMNQHSDAFYDVLHGDKDTFLIAWLLTGQPFHRIQHPVKLLESTMCQRDPDGRILFQHRNGAKWILNGVNPRIEGFRLERECLDLLAELGHRWDGQVFNPPARSAEARAVEQALASRRRFLFVRVSSDERRMELLPDHRIGAGAKDRERYWYVADGIDGFELVLGDSHYQSCVLRCDEDGIWRGPLLYKPGMPVELIPAAPEDDAPSLHSQAAGEPVEGQILDRALAAYAALPHDAEITRDFAGFIRTLAVIAPALADRLRGDLDRHPRSSGEAQLIDLALSALADPSGAVHEGRIGVGHDWDTHHYPSDGYVPVV